MIELCAAAADERGALEVFLICSLQQLLAKISCEYSRRFLSSKLLAPPIKVLLCAIIIKLPPAHR